MKYFVLFDDVSVPGRWFLGEVTDADTGQPLRLISAIRCSASVGNLEVTTPGKPLAFTETGFAVPIISSRLASCFTDLQDQVQLIPVRVRNQGDFLAVNALASLACVDDQRSAGVMKWGPADGRADRLGQYRMITKLVVDQTRIPADAHCFRVAGWLVAFVVSEVVKNRLEATGCEGAIFRQVSV